MRSEREKWNWRAWRLWRGVAFALVLASVPTRVTAAAPVFGAVVPIGGSASDIALDEPRGVLYAANFGASVIDVMSTSDNTIHSSFNVPPFPGALALSPDDQHLVVAHYCSTASSTSGSATAPPCTNAITSILLSDATVQTYSLSSAPLGVAFLNTGKALIVTTTSFLLFDPVAGTTQLAETIANVSKNLPVALATFPGQILQAALAASADGSTVWGIASAGTSSQLVFQFSAETSSFSAAIYVTSPLFLPRISVSSDGSYAMVSYSLLDVGFNLKGRYPNTISSTNITGVAIDSVNNLVYGQFPDANQPTGPPTATPGSGTSTQQPAMLIMDSDNLTFRDRIVIPEDMVGRAVLNSAATMMYAVSESGVMVLPVGTLNSQHRLQAAQEDLLFTTNFCNSSVLTQSLTVTDPGGGNTDFAISTTQAGVTISPPGGTTPATVQVSVDPKAIPSSGGTATAYLTLSSQSAVNQPKPVRLLVNNPDPSQRGTVMDQPGVLSDILPDPSRNRVYVLRQDLNQLLVFDGTSMNTIATLRTATSPTMMAMTLDGRYMLVGHDDSEYITVFDLNALQLAGVVVMPAGHYARSIAVTTSGILTLARSEATSSPSGIIDSVSLTAGTATTLATLGVYENGSLSPEGVLATSPSGVNVLYAGPDGNVALYTAAANTFVNSRHDFTALSGAFAASDYGAYVLGNAVFNASLVPAGVVSPAAPGTSGFTFTGPGGYLAAAASSSSAGDIMQVNSVPPATASSVLMAEAPLLPNPSGPALSPWGTNGSGSISLHSQTSFTRTVAPMTSSGTIVTLSTSGMTVLPSTYAAGVVTPAISGIVSAADGSTALAPGELVSIYGQNLSQVNLTASGAPLTTTLGNSCLGANGAPIPLLYVSQQQINAQLPFSLEGNATLTIHSPGGTSNNYSFTVGSAAPSVFETEALTPGTELATIVRNANNQLVTPTNPINPKDSITIFLTGMGLTSPAIPAGQAAPSNPLAAAAIQPTVALGGSALTIGYAGLAPGEVGVYQINATVPSGVPRGLTVPLVISQGGASTTINVRVVN